MNDKPYDDPREQAVTPRVRDILLESLRAGEVCTACGNLTRHHFGVSGAFQGCEMAQLKGAAPRNPERWNDPTPDLTCEVRAALMLHCGAPMEIHMASYTFDEALSVSRAVVAQLAKHYTLTPKAAQR